MEALSNKHVVCQSKDVNCLLDDFLDDLVRTASVEHGPEPIHTNTDDLVTDGIQDLLVRDNLYGGWFAQQEAKMQQMRKTWLKHLKPKNGKSV